MTLRHAAAFALVRWYLMVAAFERGRLPRRSCADHFMTLRREIASTPVARLIAAARGGDNC